MVASKKKPKQNHMVTINLSKTKDEINKKLFQTCAVDFGFTKNFTPRDVLADPYFSWVKAIGFTGFQFSGISTSDYAHNNNSAAKGYNCSPPCPDMEGTGTWNKDFFTEFFSFISKIKADGVYIANVQTGTIEEIYNAIDNNCKTIVYSGEQNLSENESYWPRGGESYRDKINLWIGSINAKYTGITHITDAAPTWLKPTKQNINWNATEAGIKGQAARMYFWNEDYNIVNCQAADTFRTIAAPYSYAAFKQQFPNLAASIIQFGWKQSSENINTFLNIAYLFNCYKYYLSNTHIHSACFMSLKSLDNNTNNYNILVMMGKIFSAKYLATATHSDSQMQIISASANGNFQNVILNPSATAKTICFNVDGKEKNIISGTTQAFTGEFSTEATATIIANSGSIILPPWSITQATTE